MQVKEKLVKLSSLFNLALRSRYSVITQMNESKVINAT